MDAQTFSAELQSLSDRLTVIVNGNVIQPTPEEWAAAFGNITPAQLCKRFEKASGSGHVAHLATEIDHDGSSFTMVTLNGPGVDPEKNWLAFQIINDMSSGHLQKLGMWNDCHFDKEHQGANLAKGYMAQVAGLFKELNVESMEVQANEVGSYAWMKYGFTPKTEQDWKKLQIKIAQRVQGDCVYYGGTSYVLEPAEVTAIKAILKTPFSQLPEHFTQLAELKREIGTYEDRPLTVGKALLLHQPWLGVLPMADHDVRYERFKSYTQTVNEKAREV